MSKKMEEVFKNGVAGAKEAMAQKDTTIRDLKRQLAEAEATRDAAVAALMASGEEMYGLGWHTKSCGSMPYGTTCPAECQMAHAALRRAKAL